MAQILSKLLPYLKLWKFVDFGDSNYPSTLQPLYNMVHYNTVLDITQFKDGFQKCIDYIEK